MPGAAHRGGQVLSVAKAKRGSYWKVLIFWQISRSVPWFLFVPGEGKRNQPTRKGALAFQFGHLGFGTSGGSCFPTTNQFF